jgi:long-chain acyl-CoA synthetase
MPSPQGTDEYPSREAFSIADVRKLKSMSVLVAPPANEGETGVYRNALHPQALVRGWPQVRTLYDVLQKGFRANPNGAMLGRRDKTIDAHGQPSWSDYKWITYSEGNELITLFGSGIMDIRREMLGQDGSEVCPVGIYAINRPEWIIAEQSTYAYGMHNIALYDTLGPDAAEFIINHGEVQILILSSDKISNVLRVRENCPGLKVLISMDSLDSKDGAVLREWAKEKKITLLDFAVVVDMGRAKRVPHRPPKPSDWATVMYTSGTTGNPKGVILTHQCFLSTIRGVSLASVEITKNDAHISYLPLAHIYEKSIAELMILNGGRIGFYRGDVLLLVEDIACLKPTTFASVPRLLNRIYNKIMSQTINGPSAFKAALFRRALDAKLANMRDYKTLESGFWDRLVFNKIKGVLGGNVRSIVSAAAPIAPETLGFYRVAFGAEVTEAYGQTESCGAGTSTLKGDYAVGSVGAPSLGVELKLVSVPDMNYFATDKPNPRGEICFVCFFELKANNFREVPVSCLVITRMTKRQRRRLTKMDGCTRVTLE